jgi:hypothetical protein
VTGKEYKLIFRCILLLVVICPFCKADADFYPLTDADKAFYMRIKRAVLAEDFDSFSEAISYPMDIHLKQGKVTIKNKKQLKRYKWLFFGPQFKKIFQTQSKDALFKNWQGVMIGRGDIWFGEIDESGGRSGSPEWIYKIITINDTSG